MEKKLAVAIIHGIRYHETDFAEPMIKLLQKRINKLGFDAEQVEFIPIHWADVTEPKQLKYFDNALQQGNLDYRVLRKFIVLTLGDASAYQKVSSDENNTYEKIHDIIDKSLQTNDNVNSDTPLVVLAHSLGGHIMSNYIWDKQQQTDPILTSFQQMKTLAGLITFGCNIPLFTFAYDNIEPISFPGSHLNPETKSKAQWLNFYDPDDILGYPLKPINRAYNNLVAEDIAIDVGGLLTAWNPACHDYYWQDKDLIKPTAKYLCDILSAQN